MIYNLCEGKWTTACDPITPVSPACRWRVLSEWKQNRICLFVTLVRSSTVYIFAHDALRTWSHVWLRELKVAAESILGDSTSCLLRMIVTVLLHTYIHIWRRSCWTGTCDSTNLLLFHQYQCLVCGAFDRYCDLPQSMAESRPESDQAEEGSGSGRQLSQISKLVKKKSCKLHTNYGRKCTTLGGN